MDNNDEIIMDDEFKNKFFDNSINDDSEIKMIKSNALINIQINTGMLREVHRLFAFILKDKKTSDLKKFEEETKILKKQGDKFSEDWMNFAALLGYLIKQAENNAEENNHTYMKKVDDTIRNFNF